MKHLFLILCITTFLHTSLWSQNSDVLKVQISGKGSRAVVLIPGFSCSSDVWKETVADLSPGFKCYALTMPGFAGNAPESKPEFSKWVQYIAAYIKKEKLDKPLIIGHSIGGVMAMWLAADYPELVSGVVVVDALPCLSAAFNPSFKSSDTLNCAPMASRFISMSRNDLYNMQKQTIPTLMADTSHHAEAIQWSMNSDRNTLGTIYCQFSNTDLREKIAAIKCPVLVLLESYFTNFKQGITTQYSKLKTARLEYATKGLHFIMYDDKDWYLRQVNAFVK